MNAAARQQNQTTSVLLVEDDPNLSSMLVQAFSAAQGFYVAGVASYGDQALTLVNTTRPDVVLLDLVLPDQDGFFVMEQLRRTGCDAAVVAHTGLNSQWAIERAFGLGASFYLVKPFSLPLLLERVREAGEPKRKAALQVLPAPPAPTAESMRVCALLDALGMPRNLLGYGYLRDGIVAIYRNVNLLKRLTTQLYPMLARWHHTTPSRVERALRHAVEVVWVRGNLDAIDRLFGDSVATDKGKPTSGEFMARLADTLNLDGVGALKD